MVSTKNNLFVSNKLIAWYKESKRELPWRLSNDPYIIWISEVILQQTRVAQGLEYFNRFVKRFPNIVSLAEASEDEVLKYWQGLGYYSRARNLHAAARFMAEHYQGNFPKSYAEVRALKGVGDYTAAAIVSFAWNMPYAVVDGNVYRVLSRYLAIDTPIDTSQGKKLFAEVATELLSSSQPGLHNQAIMELGALQCVPQNPECPVCPLADTCLAYARGEVSRFPVKQGKSKSRNRYFHYLHIICGDYTWICRRERNDIWKGLYEFPMIETEQPCDWSELAEYEAVARILQDCKSVCVERISTPMKHILSHQVLFATFYRIAIGDEGNLSRSYQKVSVEDLDRYAVPRLIHRYFEQESGH